MLGLVCLLGIIFCVLKSDHSFSPTISGISKSLNDKINDKTTIRHLSSNEQKLINESENKNLSISLSKNLTEYEKYLNTMQMCNKKYVFDISSKKDKTKQKNKFLANKINHKDNESTCLNPNTIIHNNYTLEDDCEALPFEDDNTFLNDKLSCKIISMYIKDYYTLKGDINERNSSIKEQIELASKKSDDGFVYIQMIFPNNEAEEKRTDFKKENQTYTNEVKGYFEIRCKILEINNYNSQKAPIYSEI